MMLASLIVAVLILLFMLAAFLYGFARPADALNYSGSCWPILILWCIFALFGVALRDYIAERRKRSR
jgi:hypothetical protein